jgi:DNA-binding IclR family transcriptional regulator
MNKNGFAINDGSRGAGSNTSDPVEVLSTDDTLFVTSLGKGLKVLECFDGGSARLSLKEICIRADIGNSSAQRAVHTLFKLGYLTRDEGAKHYRLTPKLLALTNRYSAGLNILEVGFPELQKCHEKIEETVNLTERDGSEMVCIARIPGRHAVTIYMGIGWRVPVYASGPGLVVLANEPPSVARAILEKCDRTAYTKQTVTDIDELMDWLEQIRTDGFVIADQLLNDGEISIAAPILDVNGKAVAAFNISLPVSRWPIHKLHTKIVPVALESAQRISTDLLI